jgi:DNA gyrase/topoisomerase IV subunit A
MNDNPHIPFTFVEVDESMYNMTLERIKQLNEENEQLHKVIQATETVIGKLDDELSQSEADRLVLSRELRAWRNWFGAERDLFIGEKKLWQEIVDARQATENSGCLDRLENQS